MSLSFSKSQYIIFFHLYLPALEYKIFPCLNQLNSATEMCFNSPLKKINKQYSSNKKKSKNFSEHLNNNQ